MSMGNFVPTRCNVKDCMKIQKEDGDLTATDKQHQVDGRTYKISERRSGRGAENV